MVLIDVLLTNISVMVDITVMTGQTSLLRAALTVPYQASLHVEMVSSVFVQIKTVTISLTVMTVVMRVSGQDVTTVIRLDMFPVLAYLMYVFQHTKFVMDTSIVQEAGTNVCVRITVQVTEDCIYVLTDHNV